MNRPSRLELLRKFFPELGNTGTGGETEAAIAINTRACEVILADMIKKFDEGFSDHGPGVLTVNLANKGLGNQFLPLDILCEDLLTAEQLQDVAVSALLRDVISRVRLTNYQEFILVLLTDRSRTSLLPIPRTEPARGIQRAQEEATV